MDVDLLEAEMQAARATALERGGQARKEATPRGAAATLEVE